MDDRPVAGAITEASAANAGVASRNSLVEPSVLLNLLPHVLQTLRREPALAITLGYLLVAMAGIFYNYSFYTKFGIPVLTLSQISDFLVAGIQQPVALLLVASTFPLLWLFDKYNVYKRRRRAARREQVLRDSRDSLARRLHLFWLRSPPPWVTALVYLAIIVGYGWMFVRNYADYRVDAVRKGDAAKVAIWLNGDTAGLAAKSGQTWTYLGAIANYVFVYDPTDRQAVILPVNAIARIEPAPTLKDAASPIFVAPIP